MDRFERASGHDTGTHDNLYDGNAQFPEDFSAEDQALASELSEIFSLEAEELPPLYVETVMGNSWHEPVPAGYEQKVIYSVFRQLDLPRSPLVPPRQRTGWTLVREDLAGMSHVVRGAAVAFFLLVVLSIAVATPSFASGLGYLLVGHTGVKQVHQYPTASASDIYNTQSVNGTAWLKHVTNPIYWVGGSIYNFTYQGVWVLGTESWAADQVLDVHYQRQAPTNGSGALDIREFQVSPQYAAVLQVVQSGATAAQFSKSMASLYVDGQWVAVAGQPDHQWVTGKRSELILAKGNTIIWITADQRDGMGISQLLGVANSLVPLTTTSHMASDTSASVSTQAIAQAFTNETYLLVPQGASPGSSTTYISVKGLMTGQTVGSSNSSTAQISNSTGVTGGTP